MTRGLLQLASDILQIVQNFGMLLSLTKPAYLMPILDQNFNRSLVGLVGLPEFT